MSRREISDQELIAQAETVTVWVASKPAPKDMWSLKEAVAWATSQPDRDGITLFRPPGGEDRVLWLLPDQIARLASMLAKHQAPPTCAPIAAA